ncbi:MAG TPA: four helix bundle protein [Chitinophagaceae bacterium]|nr:four helix bundle protein [Chitinophagaceae bacterium]
MPIKTFLDLDVYKLSRQLAKEIFQLTLKFPPEEKYSLTDQIRRSSRSVKANIAEGWGKRVYINSFKRHLVDSNGSLEETKSWCISTLDCNYISTEVYENLINKAEVIGGKLWKLHDTWKDFEPKT